MPDLSILVSLAGILVSGAVGLVTGAFGSRLLVDPRAELMRVHGEIVAALTLYASVYGNAPRPDCDLQADRRTEAEARFRELAARLVGACAALPLYDAWARWRLVPPARTIAEVHYALIGLSNATASSVDPEANRERRKKILDGLNASRFWKNP